MNRPDFNPETTNLQGHYAGFVSRMIAFAVDWLIVLSTLFIVSSIIILILGFFNITVTDVLRPLSQDSQLRQLLRLLITGVIIIMQIAFLVGYFLFFWTLVGQTPGKMLMGLRVISMDGRPLSLWQATRRFIGYYISLIPFFLGYFWVLVSDSRQGWHDKIARSYVIYTWEARPSFMIFKRLSRAAEKRAAAVQRKRPVQESIAREEDIQRG